MGALISREHFDRVRAYQELGKREATLAIGGGRATGAGLDRGFFVEPTIFTDVDSHSRIAQEEIFGPVLSVLRFRSDDDAIALANDVAYGLAATVWTNALDRAFRLAERLEAGIVWTNCPHAGAWHIPYEGHKQSGLGEDLGLESIHTFTKLKVNHLKVDGSSVAW
jgi:betaine-aldehyde dehydrogenase